MTKTIQLLRGTTAQNNTFTGSAGELTVDTTTNELRVHDGSTAGGHIIYTKSDVDTALSSKADTATTLSGYGITDGANTDLSNITATGKANAVKLAMPDYSAAYSVSAGSAGNQNTATTNGFIVFSSTDNNQDRQLFIDNQQTVYTYTSQLGCVTPIAKGSTWYFIGGYVFLKFVPCKEVY